ncbi:MAG: class I SAM-dependent methyltransferase, partial [Phocaeicola sp.]
LTALISSFGRVYHTENDSPVIFNDILSRQLISDDEYQQIQGYMLGGIDFFAPNKKADFTSSNDMLKWIVQTQIAPTPVARARYCEDALQTAIHTGTTQYVILGAGMDTFAFRNSDILNNLNVFEVDHPLTQEEKQKRISRAGWQIPKNLCFVPMDFASDNLTEKLLSCGFSKDKIHFSVG